MDYQTLQSFFEDMAKRPSGARFYLVDLHNHTPADTHFNCGDFQVETPEQKKTFAQEYIRFARSKKVEILGITDHNSAEWLPVLQAAAEEEGMILFPGVEIGAMAGANEVHFIVLFDPGSSANSIDHYLSRLGLLPTDRFHPDGGPRLVQKSVDDLLNIVVQPNQTLRGLPIAAHVSSKNGLFKDVRGEQRILAYNHKHLIAVEIPGAIGDLSEFERNALTGKKADYGNKAVACLNHSDGRGLQRVNPGYLPVGAKSTRIKLSKFSVEALRQALIDFESRVRLGSEFKDQAYPLLLGVVIENGFLTEKRSEGDVAPFVLHLNPNLNTLIGGRGAGKSALVEAIRFAFDLPARTDDSVAQSEKVQAATLPGRSRVTVFYRLPRGETYAISRARGESPEVYDMKTGDKLDVRPDAILQDRLPVEIYSQREIFEISKDLNFQLNLIESYVTDELRERKHQEQELLSRLKVNGQSILNLTEEIVQSIQRLNELPGIRLELERMEKEKVSDQLERKKIADREHSLNEQAEQAVTTLLERFGEPVEPVETAIPDAQQMEREKLLHIEMLDHQKKLLSEIDQQVRGGLDQLGRDIRGLWEKGNDDRQEWKAFYQQVQDEYLKLQKTLGSEISAERYLKNQSRLQVLQGIEKEVEKRRGRLSELRQERNNWLHQLYELRHNQVFPLLEQKCQRLTESLQGNVRLTITFEGNREAYAEKLKLLFSGNRIEQNVIRDLANSMVDENQYADVVHLVQAIRSERDGVSEDNSVLSAIYKVSKAYRERLAKLDEEVLFDLETYRIPDKPDIALKVGEQYRSLNPPVGQLGLSTGQKSTAILSIILVERDAPLVIDQPEDDLDNEFIFREIVKTLRREKERRQFIVATHNANIPVSGDAELILLLKANHEHGWVELSGSIDDPDMREPVEVILEGGRDAFLLRQRKYELME